MNKVNININIGKESRQSRMSTSSADAVFPSTPPPETPTKKKEFSSNAWENATTAIKRPKMDLAKALGIMGFSSSRTLVQGDGHEPKNELNSALCRRMAELEKKKKGYMGRPPLSEEKQRNDVRILHEAYQFLSRRYLGSGRSTDDEDVGISAMSSMLGTTDDIFSVHRRDNNNKKKTEEEEEEEKEEGDDGGKEEKNQEEEGNGPDDAKKEEKLLDEEEEAATKTGEKGDDDADLKAEKEEGNGETEASKDCVEDEEEANEKENEIGSEADDKIDEEDSDFGFSISEDEEQLKSGDARLE